MVAIETLLQHVYASKPCKFDPKNRPAIDASFMCEHILGVSSTLPFSFRTQSEKVRSSADTCLIYETERELSTLIDAVVVLARSLCNARAHTYSEPFSDLALSVNTLSHCPD